ncbi:MAG: IS1595 family transposase [Sphaerochaeta sp.]
MLKPEEAQTIEDYIKMIGGLDDGTRQEAIRETNEKLEKVEGVQNALLHMPVSLKTHAQKRQSSETDVFCPHCGSHEVSGNGSVRGVARFVCKDCKKSFGPNHGKITYQSNASEATWDTYLEGMVCSDTLEQLSQKCGISLATAHNWRLKVFRTILQADETASLKGIVEEDEWYLPGSFKGNRKALQNLKARPVQSKDESIPDYQAYGFESHPRLRGGQDSKRGLSKEKVCIPTAIDPTGICIGRPMGRGNVQLSFLKEFFKDRLDEDIVLVTDKSKSGTSYAKKNKISHVALDGKTGSRLAGAYNLQAINNFHSLLGEMAHSRRSFATKYCEEYLCWISWQATMSGHTVQEKVAALKAMVPARGKTVLVKDISPRRNSLLN